MNLQQAKKRTFALQYIAHNYNYYTIITERSVFPVSRTTEGRFLNALISERGKVYVKTRKPSDLRAVLKAALVAAQSGNTEPVSEECASNVNTSRL